MLGNNIKLENQSFNNILFQFYKNELSGICIIYYCSYKTSILSFISDKLLQLIMENHKCAFNSQFCDNIKNNINH